MVDASDGLQQGDVRISEPRDPALRFSSRSPCLSSHLKNLVSYLALLRVLEFSRSWDVEAPSPVRSLGKKVSLRPLRSHPRSWLQRSPTSTTFCILAAIVKEFTFADGECNRWLVSISFVAVRMEVAGNGHRATRDVRRMRKAQALQGHCISDLAGVEDVWSRTPLGVRPGVAMLVIQRCPEHQDLSYVYSGSVGRFRPACYGEPASKTCRRVSCVHRKEAKSSVLHASDGLQEGDVRISEPRDQSP